MGKKQETQILCMREEGGIKIVSRRFQTFFIAKEMGASPVQYRQHSKDARQENYFLWALLFNRF